MYDARLAKLRAAMAEKGLDALLVTSMPNVFYLTGFTGSTAALIVAPDASHVLVDPRYSVQAREECAGSAIHDFSGKSRVAAGAELLSELNLRQVGYEADNLTVSSYRELRKLVNRRVGLRSTRGQVERLRAVKDAHEMAIIRKAAEIADAAFAEVIEQIRPGLCEKELALMIDTALRRHGAQESAFETIAASGPNSVCPHASPTDRIIEAGDLVKMDFGARYLNYNSDITRTVCVGKPTAKQRKIHQIVLDAQRKAIDAIAPGKSGREIDSVARDYIASKGYGENFGHGLGHAIGIEVHDGPGLSQTSDLILEPGNVLTVEPGIYIEGWGGIRIEDDIVVRDSHAEPLSSAARTLGAV